MARRVYAQDISLILERTIDLAQNQLGVLEEQAEEFAPKKEIPRGWVADFQGLTKALNDLTMAHSRYTKTMNEYADKLTPEQKLEASKNFVLSLFNQQPDLVRQWLDNMLIAIDDTRRLTERLRENPDTEDPLAYLR